MDAAQVLEEYLSDLTNLPSDLAFILDEIHAKNEKLNECQKRVAQRDGAIQKYIKMHGSLADNPKESSNSKIRSDFQESLALQQDKCNLANTGLFIIARQVKKLNEQIEMLERDGQPLPVLVPEPEPALSETSHKNRRASELKRSMSREPTPQVRPVKRHRGVETRPRPSEDGDDDAHYCLCQQPSFGNMVGCDNQDCQYEWFHWDCVGLTEPPTGTWYCPACRVK